ATRPSRRPAGNAPWHPPRFARVRQPDPLPRRPHPRHRRRIPQGDRLKERHGTGHLPPRRLRAGDVEDRATRGKATTLV
ncbi:hypothetical protein AVDCRST_MAG82-2459, partial [uncultured Rubrobacteraceae bacterium]